MSLLGAARVRCATHERHAQQLWLAARFNMPNARTPDHLATLFFCMLARLLDSGTPHNGAQREKHKAKLCTLGNKVSARHCALSLPHSTFCLHANGTPCLTRVQPTCQCLAVG